MSEDKLKVNFELLQQQLNERMTKELQSLEELLRMKIKKRAKQKDIDSAILGKVNNIEFKKHIERLTNSVRLCEDAVELKFPAMEYQFNRDLKAKASIEMVTELLTHKANNTDIEAINERMN